jgi:ABC-type sugar transport system permease subunit
LILPAALILLLIQIYPTLYTLNLSLNKVRAGQLIYVGFDNFRRLLNSGDFYRSLKLTVIYAGWYLVITIALGMILALLLNRRTRLTPVYMLLLFIPWVLSDVVSGTMWRWMFQQSYGLVQVALNPLINNVSLLSNDTGAMVIVIAASVWRALAFTALILLGALQTVPVEIMEAAALDGANRWSSFWSVTVPIISPTLLVIILMTSIRGINSLGLILAITSGGPGSATATAALLLYRMAWKFGDFGQAGALAVLLFTVNIILTVVYFRLIRVEH